MGTTEDKPKGDMALIREFFFENVKVSEFSKEYKELSDDDKSQLAEGIRNGSLTYP